MILSRFRSVPEKIAYQIPFEVSEANLKRWLRSFATTDDYAVCNQLLNTMQALDEKNFIWEDKFNLLQIIHEQLDSIVKRLEKTFIDSTFPFTRDEKNNIEIIVWCYAELANSYTQYLKASPINLPGKQQANIIFQALLSLRQCLLYISHAYEQPYTGYWSLCYELYKWAEKQNILDLDVIQNSAEIKTVNLAFKYILSFYECDTNQFRPREIQAIYRFLENYASQTIISTTFNEQQVHYYRIFDLRGDRPPAVIHKISSDKRSSTRFLIVLNVAKCIHRYLENNPHGAGASKPLRRAAIKRVVKNMSHFFKRRKYTRVKENQQKKGIIGIDPLVSYLRKDTDNSPKQETRVTDYDPRIAGLWNVPDLDLVPQGEEPYHQMQYSHKKDVFKDVFKDVKSRKIFQTTETSNSIDDIWRQAATENEKPQENETLAEFEVVDSSIKGYGLHIDKQQKIASKIGDLIGILSETEDRIEVGFINRISKPAEDRIKFGIDLLGMECELVYLTTPDSSETTTWALFLPAMKGLNQADSIVFKSSTFTTGEFVCLHRGDKKINCRLNKFFVSTSAISHVELFYPQDDI